MKMKFTIVVSLICILAFPIYGKDKKSDMMSKQYKVLADSIAPDHSDMRSLSSLEISKEMSPGWNVGNSLEAIGGETAWGNPLISQRLIDSVKAAGFKSVRIPVAWSRFIDTSTYAIDEAWLGRVEEVVNYVLNNGMYAIINEHWDNGWMQPTYGQQSYVNNRLAIMWKQIAVYFRDYGDHLIFAGTNEVMFDHDYSTPKKEYYTVQNSFNQTFVNAVRSTGGRNYYRYLAVQGFNTNIDHTNSFFSMPVDAEGLTEKRLFIEVHYYDPYNFTLNTSSTITQWGKNATDPKKVETWANEAYADKQFNKMKTKFIDNGYGVILGEYGVMARLDLGSDALNAEYAGYRLYYIEYITSSIFKHGLVPMYWDNGFAGNHGMGIFNRSTGAKVYPDIVNAIITAIDTTHVTAIKEISAVKPEAFSLMQNYPNPFNPSTVISYQIPVASHVTLKVFDILGKEVAILVNEQKQPGFYQVEFSAGSFGEGNSLPSGVYIYELQAGDFIATKKLMILK